MTQARGRNLLVRRSPYGDNGFLEDYPARVPRRAHRLAVLVTSNAGGQTQPHRGHYRPRSSLLLMPRYWARSSPAPSAELLPHQRVLKPTYRDCRFGRQAIAPPRAALALPLDLGQAGRWSSPL